MKLLDHHRDHLRASGLSDSTIEKAGIHSIEDATEAAKLLKWSADGTGPVPAIAFPVCVPTAPRLFDNSPGHDEQVGTLLRPDTPRVRGNGNAPKYEHPAGMPPMLAFPPVSMIPWRWLTNPDVPILLTEGIKKSLVIAQAGYPAISAMGVDAWHDTVLKRTEQRLELHPNLRPFVSKGRTFFIAFDGGDTTSNVNVINAEARLARMLQDAGASVRLLRIPASNGGPKVGIDDYFLTQPDPPEALRELMRAALPADPVQRAEHATTAGTPAIANAQALLADLSFAAALKHAPRFVFDGCFGYLEKAKVTRSSLAAAADAFTSSLRPTKPTEHAPVLTMAAISMPAVREGAKRRLESPDLLARILQHLEDNGLVGEKLAATALVGIAVSRRTPDPLHGLVKGASGGGKNQVVSSVSNLIPETDRFELMDISPRALQFLPENLDGKLIIVEELEGGTRAEYPLRIAMSKHELPFVTAQKVDRDGVSRIESVVRKVSIRSSFVSTTTRARIHDENESRTLEIILDESPAQTKRILNAQAERARRCLTDDEVRARQAAMASWQAAFDLLEPWEVMVPDVDLLRERFDGSLVRHRRDMPRALGLAKAIAILHQRQRPTRGSALVASRADVEEAVRIVQRLNARESPRITDLMEKLEKAFGRSSFSPKQAANALGYSPQATSKNLHELQQDGLVELVNPGQGSRPGWWQITSDQLGPILPGGQPSLSAMVHGGPVPAWSAAPTPAVANVASVTSTAPLAPVASVTHVAKVADVAPIAPITPITPDAPVAQASPAIFVPLPPRPWFIPAHVTFGLPSPTSQESSGLSTSASGDEP